MMTILSNSRVASVFPLLKDAAMQSVKVDRRPNSVLQVGAQVK